MRLFSLVLFVGLGLSAFAAPQDSGSAGEAATGGSAAAPPTAATPAAARPAGATAADRTRLNLLGEVNSEQGEGRRNENVRLALIDNNVLRELNQRMGTTATIVDSFRIDQSYYGAEYGGNPSRPLHLPPARARAVHGNAYWAHNNSFFSARSFFQVGDVQPARSNDYGFTVSAPVWQGGAFTVNGSQVRNRGQVNGNVLVPAADERTPLTDDPFVRPIVERILAAYPLEAPNRTDINPRALNTNAPQNINNDRIGGTIDQSVGDGDRLTLRYNLVRQKVDAFQLVGGQNPDTTTSNHQARVTWSRTFSPKTILDLSLGLDRVGSLLIPDETSIGPWMRIGQELDGIGPPAAFPSTAPRTRSATRVAPGMTPGSTA